MKTVAHLITVIDGKYQVVRTEDGIPVVNVGPRWETPHRASDYMDLMERMPHVSPLRERPLMERYR